MSAAEKMCECGRGPVEFVRGHLGGCPECNAMDGRGSREHEIIHLIRISDGPVTVREVADEFGLSYNTAHVALCRMVRRGYLVSRDAEVWCPWGEERTLAFGKKSRPYRFRSGAATKVYSLAPRWLEVS